MRLLVFIPALVLFLSNVPFVQQMPMEQAIAMMEESGTCRQGNECSRSTENLDASCSMEEIDCEQSCSTESTVGDPDNCCQQTGTTCVCIVCFQYVAPVNDITEYTFYCSYRSNNTHAFLVGHIKDPHIGAPWQPPDFV